MLKTSVANNRENYTIRLSGVNLLYKQLSYDTNTPLYDAPEINLQWFFHGILGQDPVFHSGQLGALEIQQTKL